MIWFQSGCLSHTALLDTSAGSKMDLLKCYYKYGKISECLG